MYNIKKEINESIILMNQPCDNSCYHAIDCMQAFGGDNFKSICEQLEVNGGKAYTVCGSGDHPLELAFQNFSYIEAFDINALSRHILNLKVAAIVLFTYEEFMLFSKCLFLEEKLFSRVLEIVPLETKEYFEGLFKQTKSRNYIYNYLFTHKYTTHSDIMDACKRNFSFYNEKEFYLLKEKLLKTEIVFRQRNLFEKQELSEQFNFMYFSNILFFNTIPIQEFKEQLLPNYIEHLAPNGIMVFHYLHHFVGNPRIAYERDKLAQKTNEEIVSVLKEFIHEEIILPPSGFGRGMGEYDMALVFKK